MNIFASATADLIRSRGVRLLGVGAMLLALVAPVNGEEKDDAEPRFFDPVVTLAPGISRELAFVFDHIRARNERLTSVSAKLQYPVLSWLQFSVEMPMLIQDSETGDSTTGAGDLLLVGQAAVLRVRQGNIEVDVGVELTLPTGSTTTLAGNTAVRPFVSGAAKLGPLDLIANLSHQWVVAGPLSGVQIFQTNAALGYPLGWITPFVEVNLIQPVHGADDLRSQLYVLPALEVFLPWRLSVSVGVQLPVTSARLFEQRVLAFLKWQF